MSRVNVPGFVGTWARHGLEDASADAVWHHPFLESASGRALTPSAICFLVLDSTGPGGPGRALQGEDDRAFAEALEALLQLRPAERWERLLKQTHDADNSPLVFGAGTPQFLAFWPVVLRALPSGRRPVVSFAFDVPSNALLVFIDDYNAPECTAPPGAVWAVYGAAMNHWLKRANGFCPRYFPPLYL